VTTTGGTVNAIPLFTTATNIQNSAITQTGTGTTAKVGIDTTTPSTTFDVKGSATIRGAASVMGTLTLPATSPATATKGTNSQPESFAASSFNSTIATAVAQTFLWQAELVLCSLLMQAQITPSQDAYTNTLAGTTNYGTAVTLGLPVSEGCDGGCSSS